MAIHYNEQADSSITFTNVAVMQSGVLREGVKYSTLGYNTPGLGGNTYRFVAGDSTVANSGSILTHANGRIWMEDTDPLVNLRVMQNSTSGFTFAYHAGDPNFGNPLGTSISHGGLAIVRPEDFYVFSPFHNHGRPANSTQTNH